MLVARLLIAGPGGCRGYAANPHIAQRAGGGAGGVRGRGLRSSPRLSSLARLHTDVGKEISNKIIVYKNLVLLLHGGNDLDHTRFPPECKEICDSVICDCNLVYECIRINLIAGGADCAPRDVFASRLVTSVFSVSLMSIMRFDFGSNTRPRPPPLPARSSAPFPPPDIQPYSLLNLPLGGVEISYVPYLSAVCLALDVRLVFPVCRGYVGLDAYANFVTRQAEITKLFGYAIHI
ncbi:hypothetical protein EVAR_16251_1 [Eumeta japonica]|uniref:Uncharacterized protein n=1 Tax=Eumeta variegata TaxID=151549 RepID=A0A4C1U5S3_EUMVA|nr:hypothetical protein EVAR_16251_1 [Eumeta japonica]